MCAKRENQVFLLIVCLYLIGAVVITFFFPSFAASSAGSVLIAQGLILAGTLIGCRMLHVRPAEHLYIRPVGAGTVLCGILCTAALYPFLALVSSVMQLWVKSGTDEVTEVLTGGNPAVNLLIYALIPACIEELMNRGLLYGAYRRTLGAARAALLSAFLFGMFHMNLDQFAYTFVFGLFLCLLLEASGSLFACMAAHAALNAVSVLAAFLVGNGTADALQAVFGRIPRLAAWAGVLLLSAAVFFFFFRLLLKCGGRQDQVREAFMSPRQTDGRVLSVELVLAAGICLLFMAAYEFVM